MSVLSLYIPIIAESISEEYIKKMFKTHNIGIILRVDFVKNLLKNRREAFVHFDEWYNSEESKKMKEDILNPNTKTRFIYNKTGKFWPLLINKNAHKRVDNPNYEVLNKSEIKTAYKTSLTLVFTNIHSNKKLEKLAKENKKKQQKTDMLPNEPKLIRQRAFNK